MVGKIFSNIIARFKSASPPIEEAKIVAVEVDEFLIGQVEIECEPVKPLTIHPYSILDESIDYRKFRIKEYCKAKGVKVEFGGQYVAIVSKCDLPIVFEDLINALREF